MKYSMIARCGKSYCISLSRPLGSAELGQMYFIACITTLAGQKMWCKSPRSHRICTSSIRHKKSQSRLSTPSKSSIQSRVHKRSCGMDVVLITGLCSEGQLNAKASADIPALRTASYFGATRAAS